MYRRSNFNKNRNKNNLKALFRVFSKAGKSFLSKTIFVFDIRRFRSKSPYSKKRHAKSYLSRDIHKKSYSNPYGKPKGKKDIFYKLLNKYRFHISLSILIVIIGLIFKLLFIKSL